MDLICISSVFYGDLEEPDSHLVFTNDFASWERYNIFFSKEIFLDGWVGS